MNMTTLSKIIKKDTVYRDESANKGQEKEKKIVERKSKRKAEREEDGHENVKP